MLVRTKNSLFLRIVSLMAVCLFISSNFAIADVISSSKLRPSSAVKRPGVLDDIEDKDGELVELLNTAKKLNLQPQTLSDFRETEKQIAGPVLAPLKEFVDSINKVYSKKMPSVFGSNLPAGTINVDASQLKDFAGVLAQHGLKTTNMKVTRLQGNLAPEQVLREDGVKSILEISIGQAFGSRLFAGGGNDIKQIADANAVHFSDATIRNIVKANPQLAVVILGDEGARDRSVSLAMGGIYYSGYGDDVLKVFKTTEESNTEIKRLIEAGVTLRFFIGDALEVTNGLADAEAVSKPTNSWSLVALFNERNPWVNDHGRVGGVSYNAPTDAGIDPFDLPSVALPKLAKAKGINLDNSDELAKFMNHIAVLTLGPRQAINKKEYEVTEKHRHQAIIDDANALQKKYPGLKVVLPGDGDAMPRIISSLGLDLDGYTMVTFGRSGTNEANSALLVAKNAPEGQFAHTYVSTSATNDNYSADVADKYTEKEIATFQGMGIPEEVYRTKRTKAAVNGNGLLAITSVTGASAEVFGKSFANLLQRIEFTAVGEAGEAITSTFLVTPDGSVFVVTTQFQTVDLAQTQASIKNASAEAKKYLAAVAEKQQAREQFLRDLAGIIEVTPPEVKVLDRKLFLAKGVNILAYAAALSKNPDVKVAAKRVLLEVAPAFGIKLASDHEFYMAKQQGKWKNITVPAVNGRSTVYHSFKPLFRVAKEDNVGVLKTEVARSEMRYSAQDSSEIVAMSVAAAIKEGWTGLLFVQQDHNQINKANYLKGGADRQKEIDARNALFREGLLAGQYDIDLDPSTLVDENALEEIIKIETELVDKYLEKHPDLLVLGSDQKVEGSLRRRLVDEIEMGDVEDKVFLEQPDIAAKINLLKEKLYPKMHKLSIEATLNDIRTIRKLQKELGLTKDVSIGIEERHIDNKRHRDYPSTVLGSITLSQAILKAAAAEGLVAHSKISLQTGAMHGIGGTVDFGIYQRHLKHAKEIGVSVFVQHGASTLEKQDFDKMRAGDVGEVHLATEYQKIVFAIIAQDYPELAEEMAKWLENMMAKDKKSADQFKALWDAAFAQQGKDRKTVIAEILGDSSNMPKELKGNFKDLVKELSAPFKNELWNLPENVLQKIDRALYDEFKLIFGKLGVADTKELIESIMPYNAYPVHLVPRPASVETVFAKEEVPIFNSALIVDPGLLLAGGATEMLKVITQMKDQAVVFYGPAAAAMKILSNEGSNILTAETEVTAVEQLIKERGIAPANIRLVTTVINDELKDKGINQKIVSADDPINVMFGLTKATTEINQVPEARTAFAKLYDEVAKTGAIVPLNSAEKAKMLAKVTEVAETMEEIKSTDAVKRTEKQRKIIEQVATKVGV